MYHDIESEKEIIELWPVRQFRYLRESTRATPQQRFLAERHKLGPDGSITLAYSLSGDGSTVRYWWLWLPSAHVDGADPPRDLDETAYRIVAPTIKAGEHTEAWLGLTLPHKRGERFRRKPIRLFDRFAQWEYRRRPRVKPGRIARLWQRLRGRKRC